MSNNNNNNNSNYYTNSVQSYNNYNQQQLQQQQQQQGAATPSGGILYDISSFDPLQAHALQLTASAGLSAGMLQQQQQQQQQQASQNNNVINNEGNNRNIIMVPPPSGTPGTTTTNMTGIQQHHQLGQPGMNQQQQQQYVFIQPQHQQLQQQLQHQHQQQLSLPANGTSSSINNHNPTTTILLPAGSPAVNSGIPQAALAASLVAGGFPQQFQFPTLLPQQYIDLAAAAVASGTGISPPPNQGQSSFSHLQQQQQQQQQPQFHQQQATAPMAPPQGNKRGMQETAPLASNKKVRESAPSVISSSTNTTALKGPRAPAPPPPPPSSWADDPGPPQEASEEALAKMTPAERRRYERNLREQQRSYRISQQIKELRDVLTESNVPFKPNKYSILLSVVDYIKQLQSRAIMLDSEHQKLITTIRQTNDMVNSGNAPTSTDESDTVNASSTSESGSESELVFVKGIDYRSVFEQCPAALGIAALDGRILECNTEFQTLLGFSRRDDLMKQSLFNLVRNHQDIFRAMAQMLKTAEEPQKTEPLESAPEPNNDKSDPNTETNAYTNDNTISKDRFWTGPVTSKLDATVSCYK
jgi:PAS domain-containing protein